MKKETKNNKTKTNRKEIENNFYYIIYRYDKNKNDIEYLTSKINLIDSINYINYLLLTSNVKKNNRYDLIKDIEKIVKQRNINKYITLDINNIKLINEYIIFKQYKDNEQQPKNILTALEKQALNNNDIRINKVNKQELIKIRVKHNKINDKITITKLDKKQTLKKYLELKNKINNNFNKAHDNKNILKGGVLYE